MIQPRNYLLFACHVTNEAVHLNQLRRWISVQDDGWWRNDGEKKIATE